MAAILRRYPLAFVGAGILALILLPDASAGQRLAVWHITPEVRIGREGSGGAYEFTRISRIVPMSNGSVAIGDVVNKEIRVFDSSGAYSHNIGRDGRGPGEFTGVHDIGLLADTVWVIDNDQARISFFAVDGRFLGSSRIQIQRSASTRWNVSLYAVIQGAAVGLTGSPFGPNKAPMDSIMPVLLMTRVGQTVDTLAWVAGRNAMLAIPTPAGGFIIGQQIFTDAGLTIVSAIAPMIFSVDRSVPTVPRNAVFKVTAIQASGDTIWSKTYPYIPRRVEKVRADSFLTSKERSLARAGISPSEARRALFIPEHYSPVSSALVASDSSLWLRREEGRPTVDYWVIDENGELKAMLTVAAGVTLMAVTNSHAWGVEKDAFDVPTVVRYRIQRS